MADERWGQISQVHRVHLYYAAWARCRAQSLDLELVRDRFRSPTLVVLRPDFLVCSRLKGVRGKKQTWYHFFSCHSMRDCGARSLTLACVLICTHDSRDSHTVLQWVRKRGPLSRVIKLVLGRVNCVQPRPLILFVTRVKVININISEVRP